MSWLPLTSAQRGIYFAHELAPDNPCFTTAEVVELAGPVDAGRLARAHALAYAEFEQLRTEFRSTPDGPQQRVRDNAPAMRTVPVETTEQAESRLREELARPMDLATGDVIRAALLTFPDGRCWWLHAGHHVVLDGYGAYQLLRRICELYDDPASARSPSVTVADLVADDQARELIESTAAWDRQLSEMAGIPSPAGRSAPPSPTPVRRQRAIGPELQQALLGVARQARVTWPELVTAAVGGYLARLARTTSTRVGVPIMNRTRPGVGTLPAGHTVCTAVNLLPVTVRADGTAGEAAQAIRAALATAREHSFTRQEELARRLRRLGDATLFGAQVNVIPFETELHLGGLAGTARNLAAGPVEDLTVCLRGAPGRGRPVSLELDANPALYDAAEVDLHLDRLLPWLGAYAGDLAAEVSGLPLLPDRERRQVLTDVNDTAVDHSAQTLGQRFAAQVARTPDAVALVLDGSQCSYRELAAAAAARAGDLTARGVRPGDVVGVAVERGFALYETVHALALLGATYLPLDPELPPQRAEQMAQDAGAAVVVGPGDAPSPTATAALPITADADLDRVAYLIYTSGSTGRPKGVQVGQRAIDNRLAWMQHHLPLGPGDRVLHKTPISFDVSVWELYWPLQVGAAVVIAPPGAHRDPRAIADLVAAERIDLLHFVPSMLRALLADPRSVERLAPAQVRHVITSGEALTPELVDGCAAAFGVAPTNLYGPTEAAIDVTVWDCRPGETVVPIGRPVWNTSCYVLDDALEPAPVGVPGELWLGGVQLADGYAGRPELTAERFVPTPYGRLYRTGDLASWRADGALIYHGRCDDQVKIRGQRIEPGEVEAALTDVPGLRGAAVGAVDLGGGAALVCWYVAEESADPGALESELRATAASRLPAACCPAYWVTVPEIPLSSSGKTDRRRLAAEHLPPPAPAGGAAPRNLLEQQICEVIGDVLGRGPVAPDDDFFTVGGDSLGALRLIGDLESRLGHEVGLAAIFATPTAAGLASTTTDAAARSGLGERLWLRPAVAGSPRPPLVLLPPAGGLGWCYTSLLPSLPADQAVLTIQAPGIAEGRPAPAGDLAGLAARQLAAIRDEIGDVPFHVGGWSLGGMAAQAVAALAGGSGAAVGRVILIDAYPAAQWQHLRTPTEEEALLGIVRLGGADGLLPPDETVDRAVVAQTLRRSGSALAALPDQVLDGCIASVIEATHLVRTTRHLVVDGDLDVVVATAPRPEHWLDADGWAPYVAGSVRQHRVAAAHGELLRRPVAGQVGDLIAGLLTDLRTGPALASSTRD